jgi:hypothetical protein
MDENQQPSTLDEWLEQATGYIRQAEVCVISMRLPNKEISVCSFGIPRGLVPSALEFFARHVHDKDEENEAVTNELLKMIDDDRKGTCPACDVTVILARKIKEGDADSALVCQCGSFLIPTLREGTLHLRLMTLDEVVALPDKVRIEMLRERHAKMLAREKAQEE